MFGYPYKNLATDKDPRYGIAEAAAQFTAARLSQPVHPGRSTVLEFAGALIQTTETLNKAPPHPPGPQDLQRDYGPDGAAGRLSRITPRQADDAATL